MQAAVVPLLLAFIGVYAVYRGVNVFTVFADGARKGLQTAVGILPTMVGMLTAVYMLRASGAIDLMSGLLSPVFGLLGIPKEWPCRSPFSSRSAAGRTGARKRTDSQRRRGQLRRPCRGGHARLIRNEHLYHQSVRRASRSARNPLRNSGSIMRRFGSVCGLCGINR